MRADIAKFSYRAALVIAAFAAAGSSAVFAKNVVVQLNGKNEVPPVTTSATGQGTITINDDKTLSGSITTTGITGTAAHIHTGEGKSGPVSVPLGKSGEGGWSLPAGAKLTDEQYKSFQAGELYVNVHSAAHPEGEIRGQLKP